MAGWRRGAAPRGTGDGYGRGGGEGAGGGRGGAIGRGGAVRKPAPPDRGPLICPQKIHHPFLATGRACARPPPPGPTTRPPPRPYHWPYRLKKRAGSPATILNTVQPRSHLRRV